MLPVIAAPLGARLAAVAALGTASALAARQVQRSGTRPGAARAAALAPSVALNLLAAALVDPISEVLCAVVVVTCLGWWANFKLLAMALGRGQLRAELGAVQYAALCLMPITLVEGDNDREGGGRGGRAAPPPPPARVLLARCAAKLSLLGALVAALASAPGLPSPVRNLGYSFGLFFLIGAIMDGPGAVLTSALGLRVAPHFDEPYKSTSATEFWAKRWNLLAGTLLRHLVYDPIIEGRAVAKEKAGSAGRPRAGKARRFAATLATFAVSGAAHEAIMWFATGSATFEWFAYFVLQAPLCFAEAAVRKAVAWRPPGALASVLSIGLQLAVAEVLFFPPCVRSGLDKRVVGSIQQSLLGAAPS